ncbi:hypothetical protein A2U01_0079118, partial [Trifolium medium]|nr:hypothetical protein [Trifolium medium]
MHAERERERGRGIDGEGMVKKAVIRGVCGREEKRREATGETGKEENGILVIAAAK